MPILLCNITRNYYLNDNKVMKSKSTFDILYSENQLEHSDSHIIEHCNTAAQHNKSGMKTGV